MSRRARALSSAAVSVLALVGCSAAPDSGAEGAAPLGVGTQVRPVGDLFPESTVTLGQRGEIVYVLADGAPIGVLPQGRCPGREDTDPQFEDGTIVWTRVDGGPVVPLSSTDGPTGGGGTFGRGFTQSPRGAALAGLHLINAAARGAAEAFEVLDSASIPAPDRRLIGYQEHQSLLDHAGAAASTAANTPEETQPANGFAPKWAAPLGNVEAYRVTAWTANNPRSAVLDYAAPTEHGTFTTRRYVLHWAGGQWVLEVNGSGPVTATSTTTTLAGWNRFPAAADTVRLCTAPPS